MVEVVVSPRWGAQGGDVRCTVYRADCGRHQAGGRSLCAAVQEALSGLGLAFGLTPFFCSEM